MKIHHKITWITCLLFGSIFAITSILIYKPFIASSESIFFEDLSYTARISAMFYLEEDELNASNFSPIQTAFNKFNPEHKISVYHQNNTTAFNTTPQQDITQNILNIIQEKKEHNFKINNIYYSGLFYEDNQGDFIIVVGSKNALLEKQKHSLLLILCLAFVTGMLVLTILTLKLSKYAYKPVRNIIKQVGNLELNSKELHLSYPKTKDELEELFEAFNVLLQEIKQGYQLQKNFVDHASHELKTPLASIISELEITLQRERDTETYIKTNKSLLQSARKLEQILKNLLLLSGINRQIQDKSIVRIDEIIWQIITDLQDNYPNRFEVLLHIPAEKSNVLTVTVNETMIYMALYNLVENAAKFSEKPVTISLDIKQDQLAITIKDQGIGIPKEALTYLKQPFYRGQNASSIDGNGLGFSIASIILEAHSIDLDVKSALNQGTTITLLFQ
ncbi:sensor histidine kinase [Gaetbulibacter saemankumensis]|uniref:sensor histidine kinase n=1 Tax=Gaetbulibacter saemankumensis TaxID=311208 RepID=UPI0003FB6E14|nr:HAMP domain-containing sensor histidine kinase [Gaetbulibacter saemankumensis]